VTVVSKASGKAHKSSLRGVPKFSSDGLDSTAVVINTSSKQPSDASDSTMEVMREVFALSSLGSHPHILRYHDAWKERNSVYIVTELCLRSLSSSLGSIETPPLPERAVLAMLVQLTDALAHIHQSGIAHLDIKPANIFMSAAASQASLGSEEEGHVDSGAEAVDGTPNSVLSQKEVCLKIGDFGLATRRHREETQQGADEPPEGDGRYMCPSLLRNKCQDLAQADIFSLGMSIYAVALGVTLCAEEYDEVRSSGAFSSASHLPTEVDDLIESMIGLEPQDRPSAEQVHAGAVQMRDQTGVTIGMLFEDVG